MNLILKDIEIRNFRTIGEGILNIEKDITTLVGANESGKTNLLEAIQFLDMEFEIQNSDTKLNSDFSKKNLLPTLIFKFELSSELIAQLNSKNYTDYFQKNKEILVYREGNEEGEFYVEPVKGKFNFNNAYKNISEENQKLQTKKGEVTLQPGYFTTAQIQYVKVQKLFKDGKIKKIEDKERDKLLLGKLEEIIFDQIPNVFLWAHADKYYIPKDIPINFYEDADSYQSVINLFKLGGIEQKDIASHLAGRDSEYIFNFLDDLSRKVTAVINATWKQRKNIKLNLHYKGEQIEILVQEKGYQIDPKKRSEGMQWYLSFLINFRSKLTTLKNNIILFDQPGDKLHPGGQKDLLERIEEIAEYNQVIYTTHTPFMISKDHPERIRLITRPEDDTVIINNISKKEIFKDELLRHSLGFVLSDISPVAEKNILVEGLLDKVVILEMIEKLRPFGFSINLNQAIIIPTFGASKILYYANFLKSNGLNLVAIFDNDTEGKTAITANKKKKVLDNKEILLVGLKNVKAETMEDLLPKSIVIESINEVGKECSSNFSKISNLNIPMMAEVKKHFTAQGIDYTDELKFKLSIAIIDKFKKHRIAKTDLNGNLSGLYDLIKEVKKKIA